MAVFYLLRHQDLERRQRLERAPGDGAKLYWLSAQFTSRFVECGGDRIHYVQAGSGPHLLLLHGIGASVYSWRFVLDELTRHYTVTALDLPGFGRSSKRSGEDYGLDRQCERLIAFADQLGIDSARLVGSSMGGAIALWMAQKNPQRFPEVAVLAPATNPEIIPRRLSRVAALTPFAHRTLNRSTMKLILGQVVSRAELVVDDTIDAYLEPFQDDGDSMRAFLAALELLGDPRLPTCFRGIKSRVFVAHGDRDRMVSAKSVTRLLKHIPHAELHTHPYGGHHIMEDDPEWTVKRLLAFFARR